MTERSIFLAALDLQDVAERQKFLEAACEGNPQLRQEIEALLRSHERAGSFLGTPAGAQLAGGINQPTVQSTPAASSSAPSHADSPEDESDNAEAAVLALLSPSEQPNSLGCFAHYEIHEVLGRGAFGVVLKAFDTKLHRMVAIKAMNPDLAATSPPRKRFLREARSAAAIKDEHIVSIYAVEEQPIPYIVMEYVPGKTLQNFLDEHGPLELQDVLRIGHQIAAGLSAAHEKGLIHRDIKPANILLDTGLEIKAKLTDFGLARAADDASLTQSGLIAGTPLYMAPEQARGQTLDHRADLFSFGSVLYTMVCGRPPFRAPNTMAVLKRVCEDTPRPITELVPETPGWLCDIISRLHAKDPEDRFTSAKEVAELLSQSLQHVQQHPQDAARYIQVPLPSRPKTSSSVQPYLHPLLLLALCGLAAIAGCGVGMGMLGMMTGAYLAVTSIGAIVCTAAAALSSLWLVRRQQKTSQWPFRIRPADLALVFGTVFLGIWWTCLIVSSHRPQERDFYTTIVVGTWLVFFLGVVVPRLFSRLGPSQPADLRWLSPNFQPSEMELAEVVSRLQAPAFWLMITGVINIIAVLAFEMFVRLGVFELALPMIANTVILVGSRKMSRGQSYGWCIAASVFAILIGPAYPIGIPTGIWSLFVLSRPDVQVLFKRFGSRLDSNSQQVKPRKSAMPFAVAAAMLSLMIGFMVVPGLYFMLERWNRVVPIENGNLIVQSDEPFVSVMVDDGQLIDLPGRSALELQLPSGMHMVVFMKDGEVLHHQTVKITAGLNHVVRWPEDQDEVVAAATASESDWQSLFNGRDLTGWSGPNNDAAAWNVQQGLLVGESGMAPLVSKADTFDNFEFRGEVRLNENGRSDIVIRVPADGALPGHDMNRRHGYHIPLVAGNAPNATGMSRSGALEPLANPTGANIIQANVWFHFRVRALGPSFDVWIDNVHTTSAVDPQLRYIGKHIALMIAAPNTRAEFRNLGVRRLSANALLPMVTDIKTENAPDVAPPTSEPVAVPVRKVLFNGRDLEGWMTHPDEPGQWRVENGVLIGSGKPSCLFTQQNDFSDFVLHAEVSINQNGDGGILMRVPFQLPGKNSLPGYEAQIQSGKALVPGWTTGAIGRSDPLTGWRLAHPTETHISPDEFVPMMIAVKGTHIETYLAGRKVADYNDSRNAFPSGRIALQQSGPNTVIRFRKLEVYELRQPNSAPVVQPAAENETPVDPGAPVSALEPENRLMSF